MTYNLTVNVPVQYALIGLASDVERPTLHQTEHVNLGGGFNSAVVASLAFNLWTVGVMNAPTFIEDLRNHQGVPEEILEHFSDLQNQVPVRFDLNTSGGVTATYDLSLVSPSLCGLYEKLYAIWHPDHVEVVTC